MMYGKDKKKGMMYGSMVREGKMGGGRSMYGSGGYASIQDMENNDRATLEFFNDKNESDIEDFWIFNQLKAKYNKRASDKIINSLQDFVDNFLVKNSLNIKINYNSYDLMNKEKEDLLNHYNYEILQQNYNDDNLIEAEGEDELPF